MFDEEVPVKICFQNMSTTTNYIAVTLQALLHIPRVRRCLVGTFALHSDVQSVSKCNGWCATCTLMTSLSGALTCKRPVELF